MLDKLGHKNFTLIGKMMSLHSARNRVISQNIANANTPNYRRRQFSFESALVSAMEGGDSNDYRGIRGHVTRPNNTAVRNNGNNVDIDMEMLALKENAANYQIYTQLYNRKAQTIKHAIRGA